MSFAITTADIVRLLAEPLAWLVGIVVAATAIHAATESGHP